MTKHLVETESQALIPINQTEVQRAFTTVDGIGPYLDLIRKKIDTVQFDDATTPKGRSEIKRFARRVIASKTLLENVGKEEARKAKELPKIIDANRKAARDTLDQWADEIRAPVTAWEAAEEARITAHSRALAEINNVAAQAENCPAKVLRTMLAQIEKTELGARWQEYEEEAARAVSAARALLMDKIAAREKYEAEQAELEALRQMKAERDAQDRAEALKREVEEKAKAEAQRAMAAEREAAQRREAELLAQAERAKREAADTEARISREAAQAKAAQEAATRAREADKAHRAAIHRAAAEALVEAGLSEDGARAAVIAIAQGKVPGIHITY